MKNGALEKKRILGDEHPPTNVAVNNLAKYSAATTDKTEEYGGTR